LTEKVYERIGRQYVRLMAKKLREIEEEQTKLKRGIAEILRYKFEDLVVTDLRKARDFLHEAAILIDRYRSIDEQLNDFKAHLEGFTDTFNIKNLPRRPGER